jgi:hypothetical protein
MMEPRIRGPERLQEELGTEPVLPVGRMNHYMDRHA